MPRLPIVFALAFALNQWHVALATDISVTSLEPSNEATQVAIDAVIRVQFSAPIDPNSLTERSIRLTDNEGHSVQVYRQSDLTGGVVTLTPTLRLTPDRQYRFEITTQLRSASGGSARRFTSTFRTSKTVPPTDKRFICKRAKIADRDHNSAIAIGPDGNLYVADTFGEIRRYRLNADTGLSTAWDVPYRNPGEQIVGLRFDPAATAERLSLWTSSAWYDEQYSGTIAKLELPRFGEKTKARRQEYIVGLPHDKLLHHQPNGIDFGPDGYLYQTVGGVATLGGNPNWGMKETPLSASVIRADVRSPKFNAGKLPCYVRTIDPVNYDPTAKGCPVEVFATGFRNAYGICWHSTGHLFTATNQNSIKNGVNTPASPDGNVPAITAIPEEMLYRVVRGKYYGHPNPSRSEYVLNGGNPTSGRDPFEVTEYPPGVKPLPNFDASLIYNLRPGGGNSANGMIEYTAKGPLRGRLLIAYFSGAKTVQTFAIARDGRITHEHALTDVEGNPHRFRGAIDVAAHPTTGRVYIADFGDWERPNLGHKGAVWMLEPEVGRDE